MGEIKVNEEMTRLALAAHDVAKLKRDEPEAYEFVMCQVINNARCTMDAKLEGQDKLTAMVCKSAMEAIYSRIYEDPFALIEIEQMIIQEIDKHKEERDKES